LNATSDPADPIRALVAEALDDTSVELDGLHRLTTGANRETWSFDAVLATGERRPLVLRRDRAAGSATDGAPGFAMEVAALRAAAGAGVPVPAVIAAGDEGTAIGAPFVLMERLEGETLPKRILRDDAYAAARGGLAERCGEILAAIHSIPIDAVPGIPTVDPLGSLRQRLDGFEDESPALELALRWLEMHPRPPVEETFVHGDFRNGNLIVGPDGIRAVLDWELAHVGDPMEDLGHLCARAWRFGGAGPVGGGGDYDDLIRGYGRVSGRRLERHEMRWWELRATVWWGIACMEMGSRHLSGEVRSVELAAVGRRTWEQEYDAMLLLADEVGAA
jgi:aminoglycoside phosphotransferase (APT) family kinase protein